MLPHAPVAFTCVWHRLCAWLRSVLSAPFFQLFVFALESQFSFKSLRGANYASLFSSSRFYLDESEHPNMLMFIRNLHSFYWAGLGSSTLRLSLRAEGAQKHHESAALVCFSAQLTMIFHPITTMSCIKLILLSVSRCARRRYSCWFLPQQTSPSLTLSLSFSPQQHFKTQIRRLRGFLLCTSFSFLMMIRSAWRTSVVLCEILSMHACNTRFHCFSAAFLSLLLTKTNVFIHRSKNSALLVSKPPSNCSNVNFLCSFTREISFLSRRTSFIWIEMRKMFLHGERHIISTFVFMLLFERQTEMREEDEKFVMIL